MDRNDIAASADGPSGRSGGSNGTGGVGGRPDYPPEPRATGYFAVERAGSGSGTVEITPPGDQCGGNSTDETRYCVHEYVSEEDRFTVTATADSISTFVGWEGGGCGDEPTCEATLSEGTLVTARFEATTLQTPFAWSFGGEHPRGDHITSLAVGPSGDVYFGATFNWAATLGEVTLTSKGYSDGLVGRLDITTGKVLWFQQLGSQQPDEQVVVWFDASGHLHAMALLSGEATVGNESLTVNRSTAVFVELDPVDGSVSSVRPYDRATHVDVRQVVPDANEDLLLVGTVGNEAEPADIAVAKLSGATGDEVWFQRVGSQTSRPNAAIAVGPAGDVYVVGLYEGAPDFGGGSLPSSPRPSSFVLRLSGSDGSHVWSRRLHEGGGEGSVAVNASGAVFVGTTELDAAAGRVARLDADDGSELWVRQCGYGPRVVIDLDGHPLATSELEVSADVGGLIVSRGNQDVLFAKFSTTDGSPFWAARVGGTGSARNAFAVPFGPSDYLLGMSMNGRIELVGTTLESHNGSADAAILRLSP